MNKILITILSAGVATLVSTSCVEAQDEDRLEKFVPTELYNCSFRDGKNWSDLDAVIENWTTYMDEQEADSYTAWTLRRQYYMAAQVSQVIWLGAWNDGNAMGVGKDNYRATGREINAQFTSVLECRGHTGFVSRAFKLPSNYDEGPPDTAVATISNCMIEDGATYDTVAAAMSAWAQVLTDDGSEVAIYQWWPAFGSGEMTYDFKLLNFYQNYASLGADVERLANGALWRKRSELLRDQIDCDVPRVYDGTLRRTSQLR